MNSNGKAEKGKVQQRHSSEWPRGAVEKISRDWYSNGVVLICDDGTGDAKAK